MAESPSPELVRAWRERTASRSLDRARQRAERNVQRFLDAAWEVMPKGPGGDFTVQEVVDNAGASLRSFYNYFETKQDLMFVMLEDLVGRLTADLAEEAAAVHDPVERLHRALLNLHRMYVPDPECTRATLASFAQHILLSEPALAAALHGQMVDVFTDLVAGVTGEHRDDAARTALGIMHMVSGIALQQGVVEALGHKPWTGEAVWEICWKGVVVPATGQVTSSVSKAA